MEELLLLYVMQNQETTSQVFDLSINNFKQEVIDNTTPILIDFWAPWCPPCRAMKPILEQVSQALAGKVRVAKINIEEEPQIADLFGIKSIPTCFLMRGERPVATFVGLIQAQDLVRQVSAKL